MEVALYVFQSPIFILHSILKIEVWKIESKPIAFLKKIDTNSLFAITLRSIQKQAILFCLIVERSTPGVNHPIETYESLLTFV
jgi:hypothetical protein